MQVALSFSSMTMCGLIHASILKMGRSYVTEEEEAEFIHHCRDFALRQGLPLHTPVRLCTPATECLLSCAVALLTAEEHVQALA